MPAGAVTVEPAGAVTVEPAGAVTVEPAGAVTVESVLSVLCGARDVVAGASRVPLDGADSEALVRVVAAAGRLRSATEALLLNATAALEAMRAGSGRTALREQARLSVRRAKRTVQVSEQVAQMPNVARGLALGELTAEHAEVLADAARRTSPQAVNDAAELLEAAAVVAPEVLRRGCGRARGAAPRLWSRPRCCAATPASSRRATTPMLLARCWTVSAATALRRCSLTRQRAWECSTPV